MRVISRKKLREAALKHHDIETSLDVWFRIAKAAKWQNIKDVRKTFASADPVEGFTVFNVKGNKYRLIARIEYKKQMIFVKHVLTHAEYDTGKWKQ